MFHVFGVGSLLVVEKALLRRNDLAASFFCVPGIQKLVDRWDKCLNEFGRYVAK